MLRHRRSLGKHRRWATAVLVAVVAGSLSPVVSEPAFAADVQLGSTIGVGRYDDTRVLGVGGDGASEGSPVVTAAYVPGVAGSGVDRQRWVWERQPAGSGPEFTYVIRNLASGKCLVKAPTDGNGAKVVLSACTAGARQLWGVPSATHYDGFTLFSLTDGRCVDIPNASAGLGVQVMTYDCNGGWNQRWQRRSGSFDCGTRSREWTITNLCVRAEEPVLGVDASWRSNPVAMTWLDPNTWVLSNRVQNYVTFNRSGVYSGLEYGWRAERSTQQNGPVTYNLYWSEWNDQRLDYYAVPASAAPGSTTASGMEHSYSMFPAATGDQWDLFYDFNPVTRTRLQKPGEVRDVNTGLAIRYLRSTTVPTAFDNRVQLATGTSGMRRPYVREVATGEPKTCTAPPHYNDFGYANHAPNGADSANRSPWCFTTSVGTLGNPTGTGTEIDYLRVGKPATSLIGVATKPTTVTGAAGVLNGVDQNALANCLAKDASTCMATVPGLAECVTARKICNGLRPTEPKPRAIEAKEAMTGEQALAAAARTIDVAGEPSLAGSGPKVKTVPATVVDARYGTRLAAQTSSTQVVTGTGRATGLAASAQAFDGYVLVFDTASHNLLYACLGSQCPTT